MFATKNTVIVPEIYGEQNANTANLGQIPNLELESGTTGAPGHIVQQDGDKFDLQFGRMALGSSTIFPAGHIVNVTQAKSLTIASKDTTSFAEISSDYRISVTPLKNNSRIYLQFYFLTNTNMASNTLFQFDIRYLVSGSLPTGGRGSAADSTNGKITSDGGTMSGNIGSRLNTHFVGRPGNGYDSNDQLTINIQGYDEPAGASRTYGLIYKRESGGTGTMYVNHSTGNNDAWGFMTPMLMTAMEVQL